MESRVSAAVADSGPGMLRAGSAGPHVVDWDAEAPPAVVDWDAEDGAGYHVDWDAALVRSPLVTDWDNLSDCRWPERDHHQSSEGLGAAPAAEKTGSADPSKLSGTGRDDSETRSEASEARKKREPRVVDWDEDKVRGPIVMDWDGVSTRDTYPLPSRNSIMALGIMDWDTDSIRKPMLMDWDQDAQKRPFVTDWDLITPGRDRSSGSRAAAESDALRSSEGRSSGDSRRGKKWVVDDVLLQAAAEASAAQRRRVGPGRSTIMRSNLIDWDAELEREAMEKADAEAEAIRAEERAREAEAKAKAKAAIRAKQPRPKADEVPKKIFRAGGPAWEASSSEESEEAAGFFGKFGKVVSEIPGRLLGKKEPSEKSYSSCGITERPVTLEVEIDQAQELTPPPGIEAYITLSLEAQKEGESKTLVSKNTETAEKSPDPVWDEVVELTLTKPPFANELKLVVYGYMRFSFDRHMGTVKIPLESLPIGREHSMLCSLEDGESKKGKVQIFVTLKPYEEPKEPTPPPTPTPTPPPETPEEAKFPELPVPQHVVEANALAELTRQMVEAAAANGVLQRVPQEPVRVRVRLVEGINIYPPSRPDGGEAFVKVSVGSDEKTTKDRAGALYKNPIWKEDFTLEGPPGTPFIWLQFLDKEMDFVKNKQGDVKEIRRELPLGQLRVPVGQQPLDEEVDRWYHIWGGLAEDAKVRLKITLLSGHITVSLPGFQPNVHPAASEDNDFVPSGPKASGWLPVKVPLEIESMGWVPIGMAPERMFIEAILPASWAAHAELHAEDELISIEGQDISELSEESLIEMLKKRPMDLMFYRHDWDDDEAVEKGASRDPAKEAKLQLDILEGKNLWAVTKGEVFVVAGVQGGGKPHVTKVQVGVNPQWNESSTLVIPQGIEELILELSAWDLELSEHDEHLGALNVSLDELKMGEVIDWWCVLQGGYAMPGAEVRLRMQLVEKGDEDADTLESGSQLSAPRSDSLAPVHLLLEIEEVTGLMKYTSTNLPEDVDAFMVFDAGAGGKPYKTGTVCGIGTLEWREQALMEVTSGTTELVVTIWDRFTQVEDKPLGRALVPLENLPVGRAVDEWYSMVEGICSEAKIRLRLTLANTLDTQEPFMDLNEEHDTEGEHKKLAQKFMMERKRRIFEPATLKVDVLEGWDLVSRCNAYAMISLGNGVQMQKTQTVERASNCPKWENATFVFALPPAQEVLEVSIWDEDPFGQEDDLIGIIHMSTDNLVFGEERDQWYDLTECSIPTSKVRLRLAVYPRDLAELAEELEHQLHSITIEVLEGSNLRDPGDPSGTDPYVVLSLGEDPYITETWKGGENPQWNETATFEINRDMHALQVTVWDWDPWSKEDLLGGLRIPFGKLPVNETVDEWYQIHEGVSTEGKVHLRITLEGQAEQESILETEPEEAASVAELAPTREALILRVEVMEGIGMTEPTEPDGVEAYVMIGIDDQKAFFTSRTAKQSREPQWNESADVQIPKVPCKEGEVEAELASLVEIQVWDDDRFRDDKLGVVRIPLKSLTLNECVDNWYELAEGEAQNAKIHLRLTLEGEEWQAEEFLKDVGDDVAIATISAPPPPARHLKVEIVDGADMAEIGGSCDPYAILSIEGEHKKYQTQMIRESLFPQWNEVNTWVLPAEATSLEVNVWDSNYLGDTLVGKAFVVFETLPLGSEVEQWYSLGEGSAENARIRLRLTLVEQDMFDFFDPFSPEKLKKDLRTTDLKIEILQGSNITEPSEPDGCDSYVIVSLGDGQSHTTHAEKQNASPEWKETVIFELKPEVAFLDVNVWDWDLLFPDELLGATRVPLEGLIIGEPFEEWYEVSGGVSEEGPKVLLRLTFLEKEKEEGTAEVETEADAKDTKEESKNAKLKVAILEGAEMKVECKLYVILSLGEGSKPYKTESQNSGRSGKPKWNESTLLEIPPGTEALEVSLWDGNVLSVDDNMGKVSIPLLAFHVFYKEVSELDEWFRFEGGTGYGAGGRLRLRLKLLDPRILLDLPDQRLRVDVVEGKDLTDDPENSKECSAWVTLELKGDDDPPYKTQRIERNRTPKWDESTIFNVRSMLETTELEVNVWSHFMLHLDYTKDFLGMTRIWLGSVKVGQGVDEWYDISGGKPSNARIRLRLSILEEDQPDFKEEKEEDSAKQDNASQQVAQDGSETMDPPAAKLRTLGLADEFRHGQLHFEINNRRVPYLVVPRGLKDFSRLLLILLFNWGLPSPEKMLRAVGGEKHLYSEWLDSCRDILCWAPKQGGLPSNPALEAAHYKSGVRSQSTGRLPATEDAISDYFSNFVAKMEAFAVDTCENAAATGSWLETDASTMGIAGLLSVGARHVFRSLQAKKFVWLGMYTHPSHRGRKVCWNDRNVEKLWEAAVPVNKEVEAPLWIPLEETPQIPQTRTLPGESEEEWDAFRYGHQAFINPWITHLLLFHNRSDRNTWHEYVGHNLPVVGMACNDADVAGFRHKVLLVNHSGGMCDHWAEALKQQDARRHVYRLNWSGLFDHPIDYKQHENTFRKLGAAWACDLIAKMEHDARTPSYMFQFQGLSDSHVSHPNKFIKKAAAQHRRERYMVEPPPPPDLMPDQLRRDQVVILDLATDTEANVRQKIRDCLREKETFQKIEEDFDATARKQTHVHEDRSDQAAVTSSPDEKAMKNASLWRKSAVLAPMCRFCGAQAPKRLPDSDLDPSIVAPELTKASFDLEGLLACCKCDGANEFYHLECLRTEFIVRCQAHETTWLDFRCLICRKLFNKHALLELAHISKGHLSAEHGSQSPEVARALHFLGVAHSQIGESRVAAQLFADSLTIQEEQTRLTGAFTNDMAETLHCLAKFYRRPADTLKERQVLERCLAIKEQLLGSGHLETRDVLIDLAAAYARAGNSQRERELLGKVRALNVF